jgi:hypothetical protein
MNAQVADLLDLQVAESLESAAPLRGQLLAVEADGMLRVKVGSGREFLCAWLETGANSAVELTAGDTLLVLPPVGDEFGVALGRIGRYKPPQPATPQPHVTIEATETLVLKCGEASVDLRADGKLMIRGEDMLLRAKGTQRIKAGSVNIN